MFVAQISLICAIVGAVTGIVFQFYNYQKAMVQSARKDLNGTACFFSLADYYQEFTKRPL